MLGFVARGKALSRARSIGLILSLTSAVLAAGQQGARATGGFNVSGATAPNITTVAVTFDAIPNSAQATTITNYSVPGLTLSGTPVLNNRTVTLSTTVQTAATQYTITVSNVTRASDGLALTNNSASWIGQSAPVLDPSKTPTLGTVAEDAAAPAGAVGALVNTLVDFTNPPGQLDNVTDPDVGAVTGIAVIATDSALECSYSLDGGTTWWSFGVVTSTSARLLAADGDNRVYCRGLANANGAYDSALTIRAWDQTDGSDGGGTSTATNGGSTAYSAATDGVALSISAVNDAPVLDASKSPVLADVSEDSSAPVGTVGTPVSDLVDLDSVAGGLDNVDDPDAGAVTGVAIVGVDPSLTCYYSYNGGGSWSPLPALSSSNAMLLPAGQGRVTCTGPANFEGTVSSAVSFRAWDQTSGAAGATVDTTSNGGTTAFSTATDSASLTVTGTNDAPVLDTTKAPTLPTIDEDSPAPTGPVGALVSDLVDLTSPAGGLDNVTDIDVGAVTGMAVVGSDGAFTCYYSLNNGTDWFPFGDLGQDTARLLAADNDNRIYCRGNANVNGSGLNPLWFAAWDQTVGVDGGQGNASTRGAGTAYSDAIDYVELNVSPVDDPMYVTNMNAPETYYTGQPLDLTDIGITEVDGDPMTATLTLSDPAAGSLSTETWGSSVSTYDAGTGVWTVSGAPYYEVEAQLAHVVFTPAPGYTSNFTIATHVNDLSQSYDDTKVITHGTPVVPSVRITDAAIAEGNSGTESLTFTVSLSQATQVPVSVHVATANRTATAGSDYTARSITVSFAPGETSKTVGVTVRGDTLVELSETFGVKLSSPNGMTVADGLGIGTIRNDDRGIRVLAPNGGDKWARGSTHRISWLWGRLTGRVTIQMLRSGKVVKTITRTASLGSGGQGHISWKVPATLATGTGYKIRLISNPTPKFRDSSDAAFRIT